MDIRKYFSPPNRPNKSIPNKSAAANNDNGLSKERQMELSPSNKQTKSFNAKEMPRVAAFSSDESDGESPITGGLKAELKKNANKIILSDDEEYFYSASTSSPLKKTSDKECYKSSRDEDSFRGFAHSHNGKPVERRMAKKIFDETPVNDVFTNKKRKSSKVFKVDENHDKSAKRLKRDMKNSIPEDVVNDLFKNKNLPKSKAHTIKISKRTKNPKIDEAVLLSAAMTMKKARLQNQSENENSIVEDVAKKKVSSLSPAKPNSSKRKESPKFAKSLHNALKQEVVSLTKKSAPSLNDVTWVDKYKPTQLKQLVGQHTEKSPLHKLLEWLRDWSKNNLGNGATQKKAKPSPFMAQTDGTAFKAALLSGPPGIGKTTCAVMACKELNLQYVETNASDTRSKKTIELQVSGALDNRQIDAFFTTKKSKFGIDQVLIMDEVDGMSGNQDRAGIAELISMIKRSKIPIICICNDRQSQKIRSLANHCFDLRFSRPRVEQIKGRLLTIAAQERISFSKDILDKIIEASNQDIRQCINSLQMVASSGTAGDEKIDKKDVAVNNFDAARKVLSRDSSLFEKQELFFSDYSIMPLFVHENYLNVRTPRSSNAQHLRSIRQAADCLAFGDIIEKQVRTTGVWNLLIDQAMFSCALPAVMMDGYLNAQLQFPSWFGKTSNESKRKRFMRQLASHTHRKISGSTSSLVMDYLPIMRERLYRPLIHKEINGVREVVDFYKSYDLVRDDTEAVNDLGIWPNANKDISQCVSAKVKSALTRALNKEPRLLPFNQEAPVKGRRKGGIVETLELDEEGHEIMISGIGDDDEDNATDEL